MKKSLYTITIAGLICFATDELHADKVIDNQVDNFGNRFDFFMSPTKSKTQMSNGCFVEVFTFTNEMRVLIPHLGSEVATLVFNNKTYELKDFRLYGENFLYDFDVEGHDAMFIQNKDQTALKFFK